MADGYVCRQGRGTGWIEDVLIAPFDKSSLYEHPNEWSFEAATCVLTINCLGRINRYDVLSCSGGAGNMTRLFVRET